MNTVGVLLAAGPSQRFGPADKLLASHRGRPLVAHAADALRAADFDALIAVVANPEVGAALKDFHIVPPGSRIASQAQSLRAGIARAQELAADRAVIVLGDMPGVTPELLRRVVKRCTADTPSATTDGTYLGPPACFPARLFDALLALEGDHGARALLKTLPDAALIRVDGTRLQDIDTPDDLAAR
jgi:molybdenum cofactor cytidylyltransferase